MSRLMGNFFVDIFKRLIVNLLTIVIVCVAVYFFAIKFLF